jgi:hypothetical protein
VGGKYLPLVGGLYDEAVYPYQAKSNLACKKPAGTVFGKGLSIKAVEINNSPKSMFNALLQGHPISITVGADDPWQLYKSGVYNYCTNTGVNHEVLLYGWDCETAVEVIDGKEYCKFDSKGNLPPGVGVVYVPNSWGLKWGEEGIMRTKLTNKSGRLCNNIADEAVILDAGLPLPDAQPEPVPPVPPTPPTPDGGNGVPVYVWVLIGLIAVLVSIIAILKMKKQPQALYIER